MHLNADLILKKHFIIIIIIIIAEKSFVAYCFGVKKWYISWFNE